MRQAKQITITINTCNSAFDNCEHGEVSRILRHVAREISRGIAPPNDWLLRELNGNMCGTVTIELVI